MGSPKTNGRFEQAASGSWRSRSAAEIWTATDSSDAAVLRRMALALLMSGLKIARQIDAIADRGIPTGAWEQPADILVFACDVAGAGSVALRRLRQLMPNARLVVVAPSDTAPAVQRALKFGVHGLVAERDIDTALGPAVRAVCAGLVVVPARQRRSAAQPVLLP
jgi:DNA-binding NarL/FixJ family response regulator